MTKKSARATRDWMKEFRGKSKLTEREVNLMASRIRTKKISIGMMRSNGYSLTKDQENRGIDWLRSHWKELTTRQAMFIGADVKSWKDMVNIGYGVSKPSWLKKAPTSIRLVSFAEDFYPVYRVTRKGHKGSFRYYVKGGKVH